MPHSAAPPLMTSTGARYPAKTHLYRPRHHAPKTTRLFTESRYALATKPIAHAAKTTIRKMRKRPNFGRFFQLVFLSSRVETSSAV